MDGPAGRTRIYDPDNEERMISSEPECCPHFNQETTDDGDLIYPDLCQCICHTPND
ncbi:hypothetical protein [Streptomyces mexicanus]|uniref:hypothetical protein n=1 Tax=Streptomyces mexicanus TaxID=178566 RepID=UPI0036683993